MFAQMMDGIKEETVGFLFNLEVQVEEAAPAAEPAEAALAVPLPVSEPQVEIRAKGLGRDGRRQALQYSAPVIDGEAGTGGGRQIEREEPEAAALGIGGGARTDGGPRAGSSPRAGGGSRASAGSRAGAGPQTPQRRQPSPGQAMSANAPSRNAPCPCGSGKKYKRCHGAPGAA
jgi:preprotein translocase subunit SecA